MTPSHPTPLGAIKLLIRSQMKITKRNPIEILHLSQSLTCIKISIYIPKINLNIPSAIIYPIRSGPVDKPVQLARSSEYTVENTVL